MMHFYETSKPPNRMCQKAKKKKKQRRGAEALEFSLEGERSVNVPSFPSRGWTRHDKTKVIEVTATVAVCMVAIAERTDRAQYGTERGAWSGQPRRQASFCQESRCTWLHQMVPPIPACLEGPVHCHRRVAACAAGKSTRHTRRRAPRWLPPPATTSLPSPHPATCGVAESRTEAGDGCRPASFVGV